MKAYRQLSPAARALLSHFKTIVAEPQQAVALTSLSASVRRKGMGALDTFDAIEECIEGGWLKPIRSVSLSPDRLALTPDAQEKLFATEPTDKPAAAAVPLKKHRAPARREKRRGQKPID